MNSGKIQQLGTPVDIYNEPENAFVADFIGESNIIDGIMKKDCLVSFLDRDVPCVDVGFSENEPVDVVIRPEDIKLGKVGEGIIDGVVKSVTFKGVHYEMIIEAGSFPFMVHSTLKEERGKHFCHSV